MAAESALDTEASPGFIRNNAVFCNSECQSCSLLKSDFKVLVNEIKLMTETINILKEELIYDNNTKLRVWITTCVMVNLKQALYSVITVLN